MVSSCPSAIRDTRKIARAVRTSKRERPGRPVRDFRKSEFVRTRTIMTTHFLNLLSGRALAPRASATAIVILAQGAYAPRSEHSAPLGCLQRPNRHGPGQGTKLDIKRPCAISREHDL